MGRAQLLVLGRVLDYGAGGVLDGGWGVTSTGAFFSEYFIFAHPIKQIDTLIQQTLGLRKILAAKAELR